MIDMLLMNGLSPVAYLFLSIIYILILGGLGLVSVVISASFIYVFARGIFYVLTLGWIGFDMVLSELMFWQ